jgi:hypothetical protein
MYISRTDTNQIKIIPGTNETMLRIRDPVQVPGHIQHESTERDYRYLFRKNSGQHISLTGSMRIGKKFVDPNPKTPIWIKNSTGTNRMSYRYRYLQY